MIGVFSVCGVTFLPKRVLHGAKTLGDWLTQSLSYTDSHIANPHAAQIALIARQAQFHRYIMVSEGNTENDLRPGDPMSDCPKHIKKQLNRLSCEAYERELARELTQLAARFDDWRAGKIGAGELYNLIHQHHNGPSRELYKVYNYGGSPNFAVARAVADGVLTREEIPDDVWPHIDQTVQFCRGE